MALKHEISLRMSLYHRKSHNGKCYKIEIFTFSFDFRLRLMNVVSKLCEEDIVKQIVDSLPDEYLDDQFLATIKDIAPDFEETFVECSLFGNSKKCDKLFYPIITERGLCYTFNSLNLRDIVTDQ